jgi:hypothetical protein
MDRRQFVGSIGVSLLLDFAFQAVRAEIEPTLVLYVSARDCKHCHEWESYYCDDFVRGLQKNGIGFRNVVVTTLRNVRRESDWPDDVKWVRDASPNMKGTPWFFVLHGHNIEKAILGTARWQTAVASMAS